MSIAKAKPNFSYHPYEMAFCGFSGSGKTTLLSKVIKNLCQDYKISYLKHDVHHFQMDKAGKDTALAWEAGASQVIISDPVHSAMIQQGPLISAQVQSWCESSDILLLEGYKNSSLPKVVVIDKAGKILDKVRSGEITNVICLVGEGEDLAAEEIMLPYLQRDNVVGVITVMQNYFRQKLASVPLKGLVLAGGKSRRMEQDKATLVYHGKTQVDSAFDLLSEHCETTYLSCREDQWNGQQFKHLAQIHDSFMGFGPMGGIMSAMMEDPKAAWLVLACDLPFLEAETLSHLVTHRKPLQMATCYQSDSCEFPEPLCTIYEPKIMSVLMQFLASGVKCPRKVLINSRVNMIAPIKNGALDNVNFRSEYQQAQTRLAQSEVQL